MSNQQYQLHRHINLNQIDTTQSLLLSQQPLSPTHASTSTNSSAIRQPETKQQQLKGMPQLVGLTTIDYNIDDKMPCTCSPLTPTDITTNYCKLYQTNLVVKQLYSEKDLVGEQQLSKMQEQFCKLEVLITLPFEMEIEQIEMPI